MAEYLHETISLFPNYRNLFIVLEMRRRRRRYSSSSGRGNFVTLIENMNVDASVSVVVVVVILVDDEWDDDTAAEILGMVVMLLFRGRKYNILGSFACKHVYINTYLALCIIQSRRMNCVSFLDAACRSSSY